MEGFSQDPSKPETLECLRYIFSDIFEFMICSKIYM